MNRALLVFSFALIAACGLERPGEQFSRDLGEIVAKGTAAAFEALGRGLEASLEVLRRHPAAARASLGMACGSGVLCKGEPPSEGDTCSAESALWSPDFFEVFSQCLVAGGERAVCFNVGLVAHSPSGEQAARAEACQAALGACAPAESDACDALRVLEDIGTTQSIVDCTSETCEMMPGCFLKALFAHGEEPRPKLDLSCVLTAQSPAPSADSGL